ncbi:hypothetical protein [Fibrisoma limi]|uniref:hypothetical protein n=1 Tax=Fibrisoma limi TaxID=663275 RepID=UPI0005867E9B|nr:hypothetical protein [Fibrisoma limi]
MSVNYEQKPNEDFGSYMRRILKEARDDYNQMSPEDQQLLDEAARRLGERVHSEIMASFSNVPDDTTVEQAQQDVSETSEIQSADHPPDVDSDN